MLSSLSVFACIFLFLFALRGSCLLFEPNVFVLSSLPPSLHPFIFASYYCCLHKEGRHRKKEGKEGEEPAAAVLISCLYCSSTSSLFLLPLSVYCVSPVFRLLLTRTVTPSLLHTSFPLPSDSRSSQLSLLLSVIKQSPPSLLPSCFSFTILLFPLKKEEDELN